MQISQQETTEKFEVLRGIRQGCILSPMLFNLYVECLFSEPLENVKAGIKVNGTMLNNLRYADETVKIASNVQELQILLNMSNINEVGKRNGPAINMKNTNIYVTIRKNQIEQVTTFMYLGTMVNNTWDPQHEIKCRIEQARQTFLKFKTLLCSQKLLFETRYRMVKCYVWSVLLYGMETWTLKAVSINKLEALEMSLLRRMFRVSWMDRVRSGDVLGRTGVDRQLYQQIKHRKVN